MSFINGEAIDETDFVPTSAGAGDAGKAPVLDGDGKLDPSFLQKGFPATQVFNGTAPTSYTDLDLSAIVGAKKAMVFLKFTAPTESYEQVRVKTKGNNDVAQYGTNVFFGDNSGASRDTNLLVMTDSAGKIQWKSSLAITLEIYVDAWW